VRLRTFRLARRGRRPLFASADLARLLSATPKLAETNLEPLIERVWKRYGGAVWAVADWRRDRLVARQDTNRIGRELSKHWRRGGRIGRFVLVRVDVESHDGAIYRLEA